MLSSSRTLRVIVSTYRFVIPEYRNSQQNQSIRNTDREDCEDRSSEKQMSAAIVGKHVSLTTLTSQVQNSYPYEGNEQGVYSGMEM